MSWQTRVVFNPPAMTWDVYIWREGVTTVAGSGRSLLRYYPESHTTSYVNWPPHENVGPTFSFGERDAAEIFQGLAGQLAMLGFGSSGDSHPVIKAQEKHIASLEKTVINLFAALIPERTL